MDETKLFDGHAKAYTAGRPGDARYEEYLQAVTDVFDRYAKEGFVTIANHSVAYTGII